MKYPSLILWLLIGAFVSIWSLFTLCHRGEMCFTPSLSSTLVLEGTGGLYTTTGTQFPSLDATSRALAETMQLIQSQYYETGSIDLDVMSRQAIASFVDALGDPFTSYLEPISDQSFGDALQWETNIEGIGAYISKKDGVFMIEEVIKWSPAMHIWLRPLDMIIKIDGSGLQDLDLTQAVQRIRGPRGSKVILTVVRPTSSWGDMQDFTLTRDSISIPSVSYELMTGSKGQTIAYLAVSIFGEETNKLLVSHIADITKAKVSGIILDLRGNGGGLLPESVTVASHFLPRQQEIVRADYRIYRSETYVSEWPYDLDQPLVILVDEMTASASEIIAAAIKEWRCGSWSVRAWSWDMTWAVKPANYENGFLASCNVFLVWQKTFGKWSIQSLQPVRFGGSLKITIGKRFTPSGLSVNHLGIMPDYLTPFDTKRFQSDNYDSQLEKAKELLLRK